MKSLIDHMNSTHNKNATIAILPLRICTHFLSGRNRLKQRLTLCMSRIAQLRHQEQLNGGTATAVVAVCTRPKVEVVETSNCRVLIKLVSPVLLTSK